MFTTRATYPLPSSARLSAERNTPGALMRTSSRPRAGRSGTREVISAYTPETYSCARA